MASKSNAAPAEATFVFTGTVKKLKAATMRTVPVDERTAVVHVDRVIEAPTNLARTAGQDLTVQLAGRSKATPGQQYVFHAAGWLFGDSIAVRALAQELVAARHRALLERSDDPGEQHLSRQLQQRVDSADLVVSGQVVAVNLPAGAATATRTVGARDVGPAPIARKPVSEHDPKWREAVVHVSEVHKGQHDAGEVTVLFPSSQDVRWFKAPKFEAGQKGFFVLHKGKMKPSEKAGLATRALAAVGTEEPEATVFTALHPLDYQPLAQTQMRRALALPEQ